MEIFLDPVGGLKGDIFSSALLAALPHDEVRVIDNLHYAANLTRSVVNTGIDSPPIVDQAFDPTRAFEPVDADQVQALVAITTLAVNQGNIEYFESFRHFGTTTMHPYWLREDSALDQSFGPTSC